MKILKATLPSLRNSNKVCLVTGGFNYDILKYKHNPVINEFLNLMYSNFFQPCILEPTGVVLNSRPSLIDNIYINKYDKTIHSANFLDKGTDDMPNKIKSILYKKYLQKQGIFWYRSINNININTVFKYGI